MHGIYWSERWLKYIQNAASKKTAKGASLTLAIDWSKERIVLFVNYELNFVLHLFISCMHQFIDRINGFALSMDPQIVLLNSEARDTKLI